MPFLIESFEQSFRLGVPEMDETHRVFVELVNRLGAAGKSPFMHLFEERVQHMEDHVATENALMQESGFPAIREHRDEHQRVPGDLNRILIRVSEGSTAIGRAYVVEQLPTGFRLHAVTMDSDLSGHQCCNVGNAPTLCKV